MAILPWQKYYWQLVNNKRDSIATLNPYFVWPTESILPKLPSGRVIENHTYGGYQVPRNDHDHDEDVKQLRIIEINYTYNDKKQSFIQNTLTIKPRGLDESPARYILRLVEMLKHLDTLETVPDATKQKVLDTIKEAYSQYKRPHS